MANLVVLAASFLAFIAGASVATKMLDDENPERSCKSEMQQMTRMRHCTPWIQRGREGSCFLRSEVAKAGRYEEHLQECCEEVRKFSPDCRCDAIRQMMMQAQQQNGTEEQIMRQKAQSLPGGAT